jgi:hypothetical protein
MRCDASFVLTFDCFDFGLVFESTSSFESSAFFKLMATDLGHECMTSFLFYEKLVEYAAVAQ